MGLSHHLKNRRKLVLVPERLGVRTTTCFYWTYINQVLCPENPRDFMSQEVLLGSTEAVNVHALDHHLKDRNHKKSHQSRWRTR